MFDEIGKRLQKARRPIGGAVAAGAAIGKPKLKRKITPANPSFNYPKAPPITTDSIKLPKTQPQVGITKEQRIKRDKEFLKNRKGPIPINLGASIEKGIKKGLNNYKR